MLIEYGSVFTNYPNPHWYDIKNICYICVVLFYIYIYLIYFYFIFALFMCDILEFFYQTATIRETIYQYATFFTLFTKLLPFHPHWLFLFFSQVHVELPLWSTNINHPDPLHHLAHEARWRRWNRYCLCRIWSNSKGGASWRRRSWCCPYQVPLTRKIELRDGDKASVVFVELRLTWKAELCDGDAVGIILVDLRLTRKAWRCCSCRVPSNPEGRAKWRRPNMLLLHNVSLINIDNNYKKKSQHALKGSNLIK